MKQTLHIFRKDVSYLRYDIVMTLLAVSAFCVTGVFGLRGPTAVILPVTWWFLIGRLIHAEALPGNRQFWLTRPYRWRSLLGAKILFIVIFIHLPFLLADAAIIHAAGFSLSEKAIALAWTQMLLFASFVLPTVAISAVTSGIAEMLAVTLLLIVALLVWLVISPLIPWNFSWIELEWIKIYYVIAQIAIASACLLIWQYARRNTFATRTFMGAVTLMLLMTSMLLPWTKAFALQRYLAHQNLNVPSIRIELDTERKWLGHIYTTDQDQIEAELPFRISGLPDGIELRPNGVIVKIRAFNGEECTISQPPPESFNLESGVTSLRIMMEKAFYLRAKDRPIQLMGTLYFTLYRNEQQIAIPINSRSVPVDGVGLCSMGTHFLLCHSAFRAPSNSMRFRVLQGFRDGARVSSENLSYIASYSPFPADFNINPLFTISYPYVNAISTASVDVWKPIAHVERNFKFNQVRLSDFAAPSPLTAIK